MDNIQIDIDKIVNHWLETSDSDYNAMLVLYNSQSYHWALFMGHITIEKLLKAYYVKKKETHAPLTHNLYRLAELSGLELTGEQSNWLYRITTFNINARYDDYKREFYMMCTKEFTDEWINKIKILQQWIKKML